MDLPYLPDDRALLAAWYAEDLPPLLEQGKIVFPRIDARGGFEAVEEGLTYMDEGHVKATKLAYRP